MKIVVLDGYTSNPGDLSWDDLCALGECVIYDRTSPDETVPRAIEADVVLTNKVVLDRETIAQLPNLKYIGILATGYNVVDVAAAREHGVIVTNIPAYSTKSVVQMVFALLLELSLHVCEHSQSVKSGDWVACEDFAYWRYQLIELDGLTMGIVGLGRIGKSVADVANAFGMNVIAYSRSDGTSHPGVRRVDLNTLFKESDVVSLHSPLTPETEGLVNAERLSMMKLTAFLINTSRGPVVNEQDLADALNSGRIAGAGLDVLSSEPPSPNNPLLSAKNCYITPHMAWATKAARARLMNITVENVRAFIEDMPQNVVS